MSGPYGMQHLKNQYCSNCKRKKLEDRVKMLPEKPEPILLAKIFNQVAGLGRIHAPQPSYSFS
jgi:hypothetical protein